jgi:membrane-associated progesterone receptor component
MAGKFEPKTPIQLAPPKDDPISLDTLSKANGSSISSKASIFLSNLRIMPKSS